MIIALFLFLIFSICMAMAAYKDATSMKIPNWISLVLIAGFFVMTPFVWQSFAAFGEHLLVGLAFFIAGFAFFAFGWLGGGDAKLMAATALWWQWSDAPTYIVYTTIIGAVLGLFLLLGRKYVPVSILTSSWAYQLFKEEKNMPYGLALAGGAMLTLPNSEIFKAAWGL